MEIRMRHEYKKKKKSPAHLSFIIIMPYKSEMLHVHIQQSVFSTLGSRERPESIPGHEVSYTLNRFPVRHRTCLWKWCNNTVTVTEGSPAKQTWTTRKIKLSNSRPKDKDPAHTEQQSQRQWLRQCYKLNDAQNNYSVTAKTFGPPLLAGGITVHDMANRKHFVCLGIPK